MVDGTPLSRRVVDRDEATLVERIFALAVAGHTPGDISRTLNSEGLTTKRGKPWSTRTVRKLIENRDYLGENGYPAIVPHEPADGKVVSFGPKSATVTEVASGASLLVDVEFGRGRNLYALSQGVFGGGPAGSPAQPNTGSLVKVNGNGTFTVVADGLDRPTSLEFIGNTAYVVTLTGEIWRFESVSSPPYGMSR